MNIKICGVKTVEVAQAVVEAGATHVGLNLFTKSPRYISPREAGIIANKIKDKIKTVIITVNPTDELISETLLYFHPDYIQLHGSETVARVKEIKTKFDLEVIKAIPVRVKKDLQEADKFKKFVEYILFDAKPNADSKLPGGNAISFDWNILKGFSPDYKYILSGGLTPQNVNEALKLTNASFLDVSSGVESSPGNKDISMIKRFISNAKG